jgi:acetyl-CoA carboxylase carboxyltransferase component
MSWQKEVDELRERQRLARLMGGEERVARQRAGGKLTVRERLDALLDAGSFRELGSIAGRAQYDAQGRITGFTPASLVVGRGTIAGRGVVVGADDFTIRGGSTEGAIRDKLTRLEKMARDLRLPLLRLVDGSGGGGSAGTIDRDGHARVPGYLGWDLVTQNLNTVPVIGMALGSTAGLGAARVCGSHWSVMVKGTSQMFIAGPPVVNRLGPKQFDKEELGGSEIHTRNGAVDDEAASEADAFARARRFLSYLPDSVYGLPPRAETGDAPGRAEEWLIDAIPRDERKVYKMRPILEAVVDRGSFFEIGRLWGRSVITGFARLDGWPVALLSSDPYHYGGAWTADASRKVARFVQIAQIFHLPIVHVADIPGFLVGIDAERTATIRHGVAALTAIEQTTVPWCAVLVRKAYGVAAAGHVNHSRHAVRYCWPSMRGGSLPLEGGVEAAYRREIEAAPDPKARIAEIHERLRQLGSPFRTLEHFAYDEMIDPRDTRRLLCEFANLAAPLRTPGPSQFGFWPA